MLQKNKWQIWNQQIKAVRMMGMEFRRECWITFWWCCYEKNKSVGSKVSFRIISAFGRFRVCHVRVSGGLTCSTRDMSS